MHEVVYLNAVFFCLLLFSESALFTKLMHTDKKCDFSVLKVSKEGAWRKIMFMLTNKQRVC